MRYVTSARLRALGVLLLEAAGIAMLVSDRLGGDVELRGAVVSLWKKVKAL